MPADRPRARMEGVKLSERIGADRTIIHDAADEGFHSVRRESGRQERETSVVLDRATFAAQFCEPIRRKFRSLGVPLFDLEYGHIRDRVGNADGMHGLLPPSGYHGQTNEVTRYGVRKFLETAVDECTEEMARKE